MSSVSNTILKLILTVSFLFGSYAYAFQFPSYVNCASCNHTLESSLLKTNGPACNIATAYSKPVDQPTVDKLNTLYQQSSSDQAYFLSVMNDPKAKLNLHFLTDSVISITRLDVFKNDNFKNQLGMFYYTVDCNGFPSIVQGSMRDIFPELRAFFSHGDTCYYSGRTVDIGPIPAKTFVGFYVYKHDLPSACASVQSRVMNALVNVTDIDAAYRIARANGCELDPNLRSFDVGDIRYSVDSLNSDKTRHFWSVQDAATGNIYLRITSNSVYRDGTTPVDNNQDAEYRNHDAFFVVNLKSGSREQNIPTQCASSCNSAYGYCNYATGKCSCSNTKCTLDATCTPTGTMPINCVNGGVYNCVTGVCDCPPGYSGFSCYCKKTAACFGASAVDSCAGCNCTLKSFIPVTDPNYYTGASYNVVFGSNPILDNAVAAKPSQMTSGVVVNTDSVTFKYGQTFKFPVPFGSWDIRIFAYGDCYVGYDFDKDSSDVIDLDDYAEFNLKAYKTPVYSGYTRSTGDLVVVAAGSGTGTICNVVYMNITAAPCTCLKCPDDCLGKGTCNCQTGICTYFPVLKCVNGRYNYTTKACDCNAGYSGTLCDQKLCPTACLNNGTCVQGNCVCASGFTLGPLNNCGCKLLPGTCSSNSAGRNCTTGACICTNGYTGILCDQAPCKNDCSGKGTCNNGVCNCDPSFNGASDCSCATKKTGCVSANTVGFSCATGACICSNITFGDLCEKFYCPNNCSGNGVCNYATGTCSCNSGYSAADCSCKTSPACVFGTSNCKTGKCDCNAGYSGTLCDFKICSPACSSTQMCSNGVCVCDPSKTQCTAKPCTSPCLNGGTCSFYGTCNCTSSYFGAQCENKNCPSSCFTSPGFYDCDYTTGTCKCQSSYVQDGQCTKLQCPNSCSSHGTCDYTTGKCTCSGLWGGSDCSTPLCSSSCLNSPNFASCNNGVCVCQDKFYGDSCQFKNCSTACLNGGACDPSTGTCSCAAGFYQDDCSCKVATKVCDPIGSSGIDCNNNCVCNPLYYGDTCSFRQCASACLNGGTCNTAGTCDCKDGYTGSNCELKPCSVPCANGVCDTTKGTCSCNSGYSLSGGSCNCTTAACPSNCNGNGQCNCGKCSCNDGFSGVDCSCSTAACLNGCSGQGICQCGVCNCAVGYGGADCSIELCPTINGMECNGQGVCNLANGTCTCNSTYTGRTCSTPVPIDVCGVIGGDGTSCAGCDGIPNSQMAYDSCGVCGGSNSCVGCDNVAYSGKTFDACGVCDGDGSSCRQEGICNTYKFCSACNQVVDSNGSPLCSFCIADNTCHDAVKFNCSSTNNTCPADNHGGTLNEKLTSNSSSDTTSYVITSSIAGVIVAGAIAGGLIYTQRRQIKKAFDGTIWNKAAINNPLYKDRTVKVENPLYQDPHDAEGSADDEDY